MSTKFKILLHRDVEKYLSALPQHQKEQIKALLEDLSKNPKLGKTLTSKSPLWSLRIGKLRIIYEIDWRQHEIKVLKLEKRGQVYKHL